MSQSLFAAFSARRHRRHQYNSNPLRPAMMSIHLWMHKQISALKQPRSQRSSPTRMLALNPTQVSALSSKPVKTTNSQTDRCFISRTGMMALSIEQIAFDQHKGRGCLSGAQLQKR